MVTLVVDSAFKAFLLINSTNLYIIQLLKSDDLFTKIVMDGHSTTIRLIYTTSHSAASGGAERV